MSKFIQKMKNIGPGALVAAAFIGPGTVTTCTRAGATSGYTLLWAMLFSTIATIVFQEMSSRLGLVTKKGLAENIREKMPSGPIRTIAILLVIVAIFVGNSAYETGNITGGIMGFTTLVPGVPMQAIVIVISLLAIALLWSGSYKAIEKVLTGIVILMAVVFTITAIASHPDWGAVAKGLVTPKSGGNDLMTVIGLIGTTVVPYNLFLHASSTAERWDGVDNLGDARMDTIISIGLGGLVSMGIIVAAAANMYGSGVEIASGADLALAVEPVMGEWAKWFLGIGLLAAGFSSAIAAPLAAAFATTGSLGWKADLKDMKFKGVWLFIIVLGAILAIALGASPTQLILVAQAANAIILPLIAFFLLYCVNSKEMGQYKNGIINNLLGIVIIIICCFICYRNMTSFIQTLQALLAAQ